MLNLDVGEEVNIYLTHTQIVDQEIKIRQLKQKNRKLHVLLLKKRLQAELVNLQMDLFYLINWLARDSKITGTENSSAVVVCLAVQIS